MLALYRDPISGTSRQLRLKEIDVLKAVLDVNRRKAWRYVDRTARQDM